MNGSPNSICAQEAIAPRSAPMLIVFAITRSKTVEYSTCLEQCSRMTPASPFPVTIPIRPHICWSKSEFRFRLLLVNNRSYFNRSYFALGSSYAPIGPNSGCWVVQIQTLMEKCYTNSFIYLDETGSYILTWRGDGKLIVLKPLHKGSESTLCRSFSQHNRMIQEKETFYLLG